jgi:hypothetical protein
MDNAHGNTPAAASANPLRRRWAEAVCAAALVLMTTNSLVVITRKCVTTDEAFMIPAGYYHVAERDFHPVFEHPPIVKLLAGLPLVVMRPEAPPLAGAETREYNDPGNLYWSFWRLNRARMDELAYWSRVPAICLAALLGALIFLYARRLFGPRAAVFAVLLYTLEPTVLAHGRVVQTDLPAALGLLVFCFAFYDYLRAPTPRRAVWVGASAALAVTMKFSMVVLFPVAVVGFVALLWRARRERPRLTRLAAQGLLLALAALVTLNAAYLFRRRPPVQENVSLVLSAVLPEETGREDLRRALASAYQVVVRVVPADFLEGVGWQLNHARGGHDAGLFGRYSNRGWWYYFPVAFALKTTLPFLLVALAALGWGVWRYAHTRASRWLVLLVPFALYTALMFSSTINIGVRYYLPAFPFLFILSGAFLDRVLRRARATGRLRLRRAAALVVTAAFLWMGVETARAFPDYMSYMNQLASGRPHWWYLSDSNLEWGDDVGELAGYLRARGETEVSAAMLNYRMLDLYGVGYRFAYTPPGAAPPTRYVALGASYLNGSITPGQLGERELTDDERLALFDDYRHRQPEKIFGGSIYLYRIRE